jgi:hypothetical protein
MHLQTLIVSESMPSMRSIPAIRSLGVGGWVSGNKSVLIYWSVVTTLPSMTRYVAGVMDFTDIEPK